MGASPSMPQTLRKPPPIRNDHWAFNGPYAPVQDEVYETLKVEGTLPKHLEGCYVRNGPNPLWAPPAENSNYHWFLGDGMVHAVRIKDGAASYANHFLRTKNFLEDQRHGAPAYNNIAHASSMSGFLLRLTMEKLGLVRGIGSGPSNTNLVFHAEKLLALSEADLPMELRILGQGKLDSKAEYVYKDMWNAHPKIDPESGKLYWLDYDITGQSPKFTYGVVDANGKEERNCKGILGGNKAVMIHDLGMTERYAIVIDCPVLVDVQNFSSSGSIWKYDASHGSRLGIFAKDGASGAVEPKWFTIDTCWIFHVANCWEEGDEVVAVAVRWDRIYMGGKGDRDDFLTGTEKTLHEYRLDMTSGAVKERCLRKGFESLEFPVVNQNLVGRKSRYTWAAGSYKDEPMFHRIFKFDLEEPQNDRNVALEKGQKMMGGEAYFVAGPSAAAAGAAAPEDVGELVTFAVDPEGHGKSYFMVHSGDHLEERCSMELPQRVPLGFHGLWVSEQKVKQQAKL